MFKFIFIFVFFLSLNFSAKAGDFIIDPDKLSLGTNVMDRSCHLNGTNVFTSDAGKSVISDEVAYSGKHSIKMTIVEGKKGFGSFGGIINFGRCFKDTPKLYQGDEVWVRMRIFVPEGFEFNQNGRNKFLRFRAFHKKDGKEYSEGYNDLYLDAQKLWSAWSTPFDFIFEGQQSWYKFGMPKDFLQNGHWETVEYYLKLDNVPASEDGMATMRFWKNGILLGETKDKITLKTKDSYVKALYVFTYWDNKGAHKTQSLYVDDFFLTTNKPTDFDEKGNRMIGMDEGRTIAWQTLQCPVEQSQI